MATCKHRWSICELSDTSSQPGLPVKSHHRGVLLIGSSQSGPGHNPAGRGGRDGHSRPSPAKDQEDSERSPGKNLRHALVLRLQVNKGHAKLSRQLPPHQAWSALSCGPVRISEMAVEEIWFQSHSWVSQVHSHQKPLYQICCSYWSYSAHTYHFHTSTMSTHV